MSICGEQRPTTMRGESWATRGVGSRRRGDYLQFTIHRGERNSAAAPFLHPVRNRPNLTVQSDALAECIVLDGKRATGVKYAVGGVSRQATARQVIVSAGAVNSPQLLMLLGIGPAEERLSLGISDKRLNREGPQSTVRDGRFDVPAVR